MGVSGDGALCCGKGLWDFPLVPPGCAAHPGGCQASQGGGHPQLGLPQDPQGHGGVEQGRGTSSLGATRHRDHPTSPPAPLSLTPPAQEPPLWPRGAARDGLFSGPLCTERCGAVRHPSPARPWHCSGAGGAEDAPGRGSPSPKGRASVPSAAGTGGSPGDVGWGTRGRPAAGPAPPWSVRYINIEAVCPSVCLSLYI